MTIGVMNQGKDLFSKLKNIFKALILKEYYHYDSSNIFQVPVLGELLPYGFKRFFLSPFYLYFKLIYYRIPVNIKGGRVLDLGCGNGAYITLLHKMGWEVFGIDISSMALEKIPKTFGVYTFSGTLEEQSFPAKHFDLITMWHSLEHMHEPLDILQKSYRIIKENGKINILIPNIKSIPSKIFKEKWMPLDIPRHLYHFSPLTIKNALKISGFRNINIRHLPYRSGIPESIRYCLEERKRSIRFLDRRLAKKIGYLLSLFSAILHKGEVILISAAK
jgi:2-polyprenyl-3-methyl-5-hydroxy-6-metoxy-1,4-benzoquinol methylase